MYRRTSVSPFSLRHVKRLQGRRGQFLLCQYTVQVDCFWQDLSTFGAFTSVLQHQTHGFADADYHSGWKWPTSVSCQCIIYRANCASQWWMNLPLLLNTMLAGSLSRTRAPDMNCQECKAVHRLLRWYSNFHVFFLNQSKNPTNESNISVWACIKPSFMDSTGSAACFHFRGFVILLIHLHRMNDEWKNICPLPDFLFLDISHSWMFQIMKQNMKDSPGKYKIKVLNHVCHCQSFTSLWRSSTLLCWIVLI